MGVSHSIIKLSLGTNHTDYEVCIEHCYLASWVYLCSTSLIVYFLECDIIQFPVEKKKLFLSFKQSCSVY